MTDSLRPKRDWAGVVGPWLAICVVLAGVVARFSSLEGFKERAIEELAQQRDRDDKLEARIRAVETSRTLESQISALTAEIAALKAEQRALREELARKRR